MQLELSAGNVKAAMRAADAGRSDLWKVPLDKIQTIDGFNVRADSVEHEDYLSELMGSILANGFYTHKPLTGYVAVREGKQVIYLVDGHCRLQAVKMANTAGAEIKTLPVIVTPNGTSVEDLTVALVTSNSGKSLTPYEIGLVCKRLAGFGWDVNQIAQRLAMTNQSVNDRLMLVAAPPEVRAMVVNGEVSATLATAVLKQDAETAGATLTAGVAKAKAAGKTKATRKHIDWPPNVDPTSVQSVTAYIAAQDATPVDRANYEKLLAFAADFVSWFKLVERDLPANEHGDLSDLVAQAKAALA